MWEVIFFLLVAGVVFWAAAWETVELGVIAMVAAAVVASLWMGYPVFEWVYANPFLIVVGLLLYSAAGGVWSVVKWRLWLGKQETRISAAWETYKKNIADGKWRRQLADGVPPTPEQLAEWRQDFLTNGTGQWSALRNKRRIVSWIAWWPASIVWTIVRDVVVELWNWVYRFFSGLYDRIGASVINRNLK